MPGTAKKIIIVDDDPTSNYISEFILSSVYPSADIASFIDPVKALNKLPDLDLDANSIILLDLNMPQLNGYEFIDRMEEKNINGKVVILTCSNNLMDREYSKRYERVKGFLVKPLTQDHMTVFSELYKT